MKDIGIKYNATLFFLLLHIPLALLLRNSSLLASFYGLSIFLVGFWKVLTSRSDDFSIPCIVSYLVGLEVLLRMCGARGETEFRLFWEFGKYSVAILILLNLFLMRRKKKSATFGLVLYFLLLLPAVFLTPFESFSQWRQEISFNLSGPFALCICGLYFARLELKKEELQRVISWLIAPIVSISFLALRGVKETPDITWGLASSKAASGGFGPNQVSSILGFGVLLCVTLFLLLRKNRAFKIMFLSLALWFFCQALLTFSRGGVLHAAIPTVVFLLCLLRSGKQRISAFISAIFIITLVQNFLIPKIDQYTKGALKARYAEKETIAEGVEVYETSGRYNIVQADIEIFMEDLLFGVGVGNSPRIRFEKIGVWNAPHVEWSRVLAEHGILGLFALISLGFWVFQRYRSATDNVSKSLVLSLIAFFVIFINHAAMRLVAPSFALGLLGANFNLGEEKPTGPSPLHKQ